MFAMTLVREFIKDPVHIGTVCPSSNYLAKKIVGLASVEGASTIVEIGPGTAVFTPRIIEKMPEDGSYVAIERSKLICESFRKNLPGLKIYNRDAIELREIMSEEGMDKADRIVCSLPWASLPESSQDGILSAIQDMLAPDGVFVTYGYIMGLALPKGKRFRRLLEKHFQQVRRSSTVWVNVPPAFIYRCTGV